MMHPIPDILAELRAGRMIVLVDDEQRENEGDLVAAAETLTPEQVNFMLREGRGMLFIALDGAACDRLDLPPLAPVNTTQRGTAYTVTVDASARHGVTTGVSASDRATTLRLLASPHAGPEDFDRPGHIQPLRARDGGTLVRAGHTEGAVDLCRLAGLRPAGVGIEIMNEDGSMARQPQLHAFCQRHGLKLASVADLIQHRLRSERLVERLEESVLVNALGEFKLITYRSRVDALPHVALTCGDLGRLDEAGRPIAIDTPVLVRMHSQNLLGDVFGDLAQPSGRTLHESMRLIQQEGRGAVVYLRHEAMGTGLVRRLQTLDLGERDARAVHTEPSAPSLEGEEPALCRPGPQPLAHGAHGIGSQILRDLGVRRLRLITNHPFTPKALEGFGLRIEGFVPVPVQAHASP